MACLYIIYYFFSNASFFCRTFRRPVEVLPAGPFVVCGIRAKAGRLDHVSDPPFTDPGRNPIPEISLHKVSFHKASVHLSDHGDHRDALFSGMLADDGDHLAPEALLVQLTRSGPLRGKRMLLPRLLRQLPRRRSQTRPFPDAFGSAPRICEGSGPAFAPSPRPRPSGERK